MSPFCHGGVTFSHHQDFPLRRSGAQTLDNSVTDAVVLLAHPRAASAVARLASGLLG